MEPEREDRLTRGERIGAGSVIAFIALVVLITFILKAVL